MRTYMQVGFGPEGGITTLAGKAVGRDDGMLASWADAAHPLAQPLYQAMSGDFFHTFTKRYTRCTRR